MSVFFFFNKLAGWNIYAPCLLKISYIFPYYRKIPPPIWQISCYFIMATAEEQFLSQETRDFISCKKLHACAPWRFLSQETRDFYLLGEIAYLRTRAIFVTRDLSVTYALLEKKISKHCTRAIFVARDKNLLSIVVNIKHVWFLIFVSCDKISRRWHPHTGDFCLLRQKSLVSCDKNCSSAAAFIIWQIYFLVC